MASENGWNPAWVGADSLEWVTVPGTDVTLQIQKGWPLAIMRAYAADYNAYIEPLRDADSASYTPTNSVSTSNHLNGTAMDLNWNSHPFRVDYAGFDPPKIARMRELLEFYKFEGLQIMFWAQDWDSPKDAMHHQLGYNTWNNPIVGRFIAERIRPDGFSTYKRGGTTSPPPPPPTLSRADRYALLIIAEGRRRGITPRGIQIALATGLVESNLQIYANAKVPASMSIPHDKVGSDSYSVGIFQQQVRDTGNGWWWGDAATCMDPTSSAGLFYARLAKLTYNGTNSPGSYAADVQSPDPRYRGRYDERFAEAVALYTRLASLPAEELDEWEALMASTDLYASLSLYRTSDNKTMSLKDVVRGADASAHATWVEQKALAGDPWAIGLVASLARGQLPASKDPWAVDRARYILTRVEATNPAALQFYLASKGQA